MMLRLSKKFVFMLLFILVASGMLLVVPCVVPVTMPVNPSSAPEVSVVVNANHFWNPPIYTTNPYTGESAQIAQGYWIPDGTIEITIKNRPFTSYTDKNGNYISVYYTVFVKTESTLWSQYTSPKHTVYQSDSDCTIITFTYGSGKPNTLAPDNLWILKEGEVRNFRVQAVTGYFSGDSFEGEGSEWVEFTVTIPKSDDSGSLFSPDVSKPSGPSVSYNTPQKKPSQQSNLIMILILSVCIIAILIVVIAYQYKQRKTQPTTQTNPTPTTLVCLV
jgi:hypothetical protein